MYLHRDVHKKALLHGKWIRDLANLPDIFSTRNPNPQAVAWHREATRRQGIFPQMAQAEPQRPTTANIPGGVIDNRAHALAEPLEPHNRAIGPEPLIL